MPTDTTNATPSRGIGRLTQWHGIASRYDNYAITYLDGLILATIALNHRIRI